MWGQASPQPRDGTGEPKGQGDMLDEEARAGLRLSSTWYQQLECAES